MIIIGAGLAGLLAGNMLRRFSPAIYEAQKELPNNHSALLRFRSDACANAFSIPFKKVKVQKAICYKGKIISRPSIDLVNMYSKKVTGSYMSRSIEDTRPVDRFISPTDIIATASKNLKIEYNMTIDYNELMILKDRGPIISTIPMPTMMDIFKYKEKPLFSHMPIWTINLKLKTTTDLYQTLYYPAPVLNYYRASIVGDRIIIECISDHHKDPTVIFDILDNFGIDSEVSEIEYGFQKYGKLSPIDDSVRKRFMLYLTEEHDIYSLGRFATWRQILLDDVVNDVNVIEGLLQRNGYERKQHWSKK